MREKINNQKGFLLIEAFVAVFILAIGIVAAVGMFNVSSHSARSNADQIVAINLAKGQSDFLQGGHPDYIEPVTKSNTVWLDPKLKASSGKVTINNRPFTIKTTITKKVNSELAKAEVTVSWLDSRNQNKETTFVSWFFPR